jgi:CheY-like chemotaxis protein
MVHDPKILVADDDAGVREVVVSIVKNTFPAATVIAVENGKLALDFYRTNGADLVISNFVMPEMSGPLFVRTLRSQHETVPIIMVSGSPEAEAAGIKAGIDRFVHKLDIPAHLPEAMRSLLEPESSNGQR